MAGEQGGQARVAVVVPVLDPGPDLRAALASVLAQTTAAWELVVVDDGSSEDLAWVAGLDPRVRLIRAAHAGVSAARNRGVAATSASWVAFLDHDDTWAPDKLERQLAALDGHPSAVLCHTAFEWVVTDASGSAEHVRRYPEPLTYHGLLRGDHVCTSSVLVERGAFLAAGGFCEDLAHAEDLALWLRLLHDGGPSCVVDEPLVRYTSHPGGASSDYARTARARAALVREHERAARASGDAAGVRAARDGLARGRELAAHQAFDAARASRGVAVAAHLARSAAQDPRVVWQAARRRIAVGGAQG